ncbi:tubulin-folding cofactor B [Coccinella septempunctata]|uniref:tubulin-folding cofactor B n=1 Tax=Coccinella septempunctata TaxID=41139 RepID=UPI001D098B5A|nr:tubulin-folding cofactor B [Coccinella septempunctata]
MGDFKVITPDFVNLQISTSKNDISFSEKRFPKGITVADLKSKLELMTGGSCSTMQLEVFDKDDKFVCGLTDDNQLLGAYPVDCGMRLHVVDKFLLKNELESGDIEKFELSDEQYSKKSDTVRSFLQRNKLGQYNADNKEKKEKLEAEEKSLAENLVCNSRCKVTIPNASPRLGTIKYVGKVEGLAGFWVGIHYDEPLGKHNGMYNGKQYFECPDKYGAFVKPFSVTMGDFPEEDYDLNEEL